MFHQAAPPAPSPDWIFQGFRAPSYTMVPDEVFDDLLELLSGAELKVLLYITRRTFGFKKASDAISLSQMLNGIVTREGQHLDRGCGIKKKNSLLLALRSLAEKRIIIVQRQSSPERGNQPTVYRLNVLNAESAPPGNQTGLPLGNRKGTRVDHKGYQGLGNRSGPHNMTASQKTDLQKHLHHHRDADLDQAAAARVDDDDDASLRKEKTTKEPAEKNPAMAEDTLSLAGKLTETGINKRLALRLVSEYPAERIEQALTYLPFRSARNPVAYLVREIQEGNWVPPAGVAVQQQRRESTDRWKAAASQLQVEREEAERVRTERIEAVLQTFPPEVQEQFHQQARDRVARLTGKRTVDVDPESPWVIGTLHNLIEEAHGSQLAQAG